MNSYEFRETRMRPSRAAFARLHRRVTSRRVASTTVAFITAAIVLPCRPARRHPTATTPTTTSGDARRAHEHTSIIHRVEFTRAPRTVPLARPFAVVDTFVFIIVPIIVLVARVESSRRRVTSRRATGGRWISLRVVLIDEL